MQRARRMDRKASIPCRLVPPVHYAVDVPNSSVVEIQEKHTFICRSRSGVESKERDREKEDRQPISVKVKHWGKLEMEGAGESRKKTETPTPRGGCVTRPTAPPLQVIQPPHQLHTLPWTTGLCDCFDDCSTCESSFLVSLFSLMPK